MRHDEFFKRDPAGQLRRRIQRLAYPWLLESPSWYSHPGLEKFPSAVFRGLPEVIEHFSPIEKLPEKVRIC